MPDNETRSSEYPKINTFTTASARRLSDESLSFPEMYPHEVASYFDSDITNGLSVKQVKRHRSKFGDNTVAGAVPIGFMVSLKRQLKNLVPVFLFFASLMFHIFRGGAEFLAMAAGIAVTALVNAVLEHKAGKIFTAVQKISSPRTTVIREGKAFVTDSRGLVPGDIIVLESDNIVPADARIIECSSFTVLETPVSGRKNAALKDARFLAPSKDVKVYENMVYAGTIVTGGNATAVVCVTGRNVMLNREVKRGAAANPQSAYLPAYLKTVLKTGRFMGIAAVSAELLLLAAGIISGANLTDTFIVSLSVSTVALSDTVFALSAASMANSIDDAMKRGGVFRNLDSFERISDLDTIMCGKATAFPPKAITLESFYDCSGMTEYNRQSKARAKDIIKCMLLCSSIKEKLKEPKTKKKKTREEIYEGSAYTLALLKAANEAGYTLEEARRDFYRIETEHDS
ncbi:MAG: cation-transporting P-type ATPase, partial [Eubacteriales bacterium]|nr:cation-transporting P-type ATPase [Eubacteriales bacterium]